MRPSFDPRADADRDAQQWIADALGIELTDTQRLILTDGTGDRYTLGKPIPHWRPDELALTQRVRGTEAHTVIHDEAPADGDGNPLSAGFRAELTRIVSERLRNGGYCSVD